jgi:hypothetical protein
MEKSYRYIPYFFTAFVILVIYCFYPTYFGQFPDFEGIRNTIDQSILPITTITHFHAAMVVLWLLLLILQPILIIKKQVHWHRLLGKASYVVVALMFISMLMVIHQEQTRQKHLVIFAVNMVDLPEFIVFYCLAIFYRKKPAYHARFMVMSIIPFLSPALGRLQIDNLSLIVQLSLWVLLFVVEFFTRKTYKPYLIGFGYYVFNFAVGAYLFLINKPLLERIWGIFFT